MNVSELRLQEFSRAVSHDLGSAIRGVDQLTAMLEQDLSARLSDKERYWMSLIRSSAERAQGMIDALTVYTRLSTQPPKPCTLNLAELVRNTVESCLIQHQASLDDIFKPNIQMDLQQIQVVSIVEHWSLMIRELIKNALEFQPDTDSQSHKIHIQLYTNDDTGEGVLIIEDNGVGVTKEKIEQIATPFVTTRSPQDLDHFGMGLSYCARIAQINDALLQFTHSDLGGLKVKYQFSLRATL
ncbi:MAG: HAMP domain-containing sensor histidine kinase [Oceanospirillaceae bacterium]